MILSGANISSTYLANRQDRYLVLRRAPRVAAFLSDAVAAVARCSYQLRPLEAAPPSGDTSDGGDSSGGGGGADGGMPRRRDALLQLLKDQRLPWQRPLPGLLALAAGQPPVHHLKRHRLQRQQRYRLEPCPAGVDPVRYPAAFSRRLRAELLPLFCGPDPRRWAPALDFAVLAAEAASAEDGAADAWGSSGSSGSGGGGGVSSDRWSEGAAAASASAAKAAADTWLVPLVQAGFAGVRQDERGTLAALAWACSGGGGGSQLGPSAGSGGSGSGPRVPAPLVQLASHYLNLGRPYERLLSRQVARRPPMRMPLSSAMAVPANLPHPAAC